jgi:hypothetical protein
LSRMLLWYTYCDINIENPKGTERRDGRLVLVGEAGRQRPTR